MYPFKSFNNSNNIHPGWDHPARLLSFKNAQNNLRFCELKRNRVWLVIELIVSKVAVEGFIFWNVSTLNADVISISAEHDCVALDYSTRKSGKLDEMWNNGMWSNSRTYLTLNISLYKHETTRWTIKATSILQKTSYGWRMTCSTK